MGAWVLTKGSVFYVFFYISLGILACIWKGKPYFIKYEFHVLPKAELSMADGGTWWRVPKFHHINMPLWRMTGLPLQIAYGGWQKNPSRRSTMVAPWPLFNNTGQRKWMSEWVLLTGGSEFHFFCRWVDCWIWLFTVCIATRKFSFVNLSGNLKTTTIAWSVLLSMTYFV